MSQHTFIRTSLVLSTALAGVLALSACGAERAKEAVTEQAVVATHAAAEETPDVMTFTADVSGDANIEMPPGELVYQAVGTAGSDSVESQPHQIIRLTAETDEQSYALTLMFMPDLAQGTHPITGGVFAGTESVAAEFVAYPPGGSADGADAVEYNEAVEGSLTLTETGDQISGHFEFTAEATVTADDGSQAAASIMAAGTFDNVELSGAAEATRETPTQEATAEAAG